MFKRQLVFLMFFFLTVPTSQAAAVTFAWNANTESDLAGYKLYYGNVPRSQEAYAQSVTISDKDAVTWNLSLDPGTYYFALSAFDSSGNESGITSEVVVEIAPPDPPGKPGTPQLVP